MNEEKDLRFVEQASFRELMQDGFTELLLGLILASMPLFVLQPGFISIFVVFYIIFLPPFFEMIRKKYIYPRIGYVKLYEDEPPRVTVRFVAVLVLLVVSVAAIIYSVGTGIIDEDLVYRWIPAAFGLIMWVPSGYLKEKSGQNRYYLFGALMTITGVLVGVTPTVDPNIVSPIYFIVWGFSFMMLGSVRYSLFVRRFPIVDILEEGSVDL
ncbi:MAG: hypothetical protein ACFFCK_07075 [Promethearchaeota archaeon]